MIKDEPSYADATTWLARAVKVALDRSSDHVKRFYNTLLEKPAVVICGRALVKEIKCIPAFAIDDEQFDFKDGVGTKEYLIEGMTVGAAKLAASEFKKDHELLVASGLMGSAPELLLYNLIDKMPASLDKEAKALRSKISDAKIFGDNVMLRRRMVRRGLDTEARASQGALRTED